MNIKKNKKIKYSTIILVLDIVRSRQNVLRQSVTLNKTQKNMCMCVFQVLD